MRHLLLLAALLALGVGKGMGDDTAAPTAQPTTPAPTDAPTLQCVNWCGNKNVTEQCDGTFEKCLGCLVCTESPTEAPTDAPLDATDAPTDTPTTAAPTDTPTTAAPTDTPTTPAPTDAPETAAPTDTPTTPAPTDAPETAAPTDTPTTAVPTNTPTTAAPTNTPTTPAPTDAPTTAAPTDTPTTAAPTNAPTDEPCCKVRVADCATLNPGECDKSYTLSAILGPQPVFVDCIDITSVSDDFTCVTGPPSDTTVTSNCAYSEVCYDTNAPTASPTTAAPTDAPTLPPPPTPPPTNPTCCKVKVASCSDIIFVTDDSVKECRQSYEIDPDTSKGSECFVLFTRNESGPGICSPNPNPSEIYSCPDDIEPCYNTTSAPSVLPTPKPTAKPTTKSKSKTKKFMDKVEHQPYWVWVVVAVGSVIIIAGIFFCCRSYHGRHGRHESKGYESFNDPEDPPPGYAYTDEGQIKAPIRSAYQRPTKRGGK